MSAARSKHSAGKAARKANKIDPTWPDGDDGSHPVTELTAPVAGGLSPFGDVTFPVPAEDLPYQHPVTRINK